MTQQSEKNKVIAVFDGWKISKSGKTFRRDPSDNSPRRLSDLHYHTSWDWLMPVVEKIESMKGIIVIINGLSCQIFSYGKEVTNFYTQENKIANVYKAVIQFITYYNSINKTTCQ